MKSVDIYKLNKDASQRVIATCILNDTMVVCTGDENLVKNLNEIGIIDYSNNLSKNLFPGDGEKFLEQLKFNFKSAYLSASEVVDDNKSS